MRNLDEYPITLDEMIDAVEAAASASIAELKRQGPNVPIGGIYTVALQEAARRLKRLQFAAQIDAPTTPE